MPTLHRTKLFRVERLTPTVLKETLSELRNSPSTRFITDENMEPWALHVMPYKNLDVMDANTAGIRHLDDRAVFRKTWELKRLLITHDTDFLDDRIFPFSTCAGLLVLPTYGSISLEFANLLAGATALIRKGRSMWFHTKIVAKRDFSLKVRTWERTEGLVTEWDFQIPNSRSKR